MFLKAVILAAAMAQAPMAVEIPAGSVKIVVGGGDCDGKNQNGMVGWEFLSHVAMEAYRAPMGTPKSSWARWRNPAEPILDKNNQYLFKKLANGKYKILADGPIDKYQTDYDFSNKGYELNLGGFRSGHALWSAHFEQPGDKCLTNNHFLLQPQAGGHYKIIQHGGDCDGTTDEPTAETKYYLNTSGWELVGTLDPRNPQGTHCKCTIHQAVFQKPNASKCFENNRFAFQPVTAATSAPVQTPNKPTPQTYKMSSTVTVTDCKVAKEMVNTKGKTAFKEALIKSMPGITVTETQLATVNCPARRLQEEVRKLSTEPGVGADFTYTSTTGAGTKPTSQTFTKDLNTALTNQGLTAGVKSASFTAATTPEVSAAAGAEVYLFFAISMLGISR